MGKLDGILAIRQSAIWENLAFALQQMITEAGESTNARPLLYHHKKQDDIVLGLICSPSFPSVNATSPSPRTKPTAAAQ